MSLLESARGSVVRDQRARELASDQRAGAWSKREIRRERRAWLGKNRHAFAELAAGVAIVCGVIQLVRPAFVRPYLVGAVLASAAWMVHYVMMLVGGATRKIVGIFGEIWTSDELGGLRRHGWHVVNHVMLENRDVDHVLLGPVGSTRSRPSFARSGKMFAGRRQDLRLGRMKMPSASPAESAPRANVHALVVLWGGGSRQHRTRAIRGRSCQPFAPESSFATTSALFHPK